MHAWAPWLRAPVLGFSLGALAGGAEAVKHAAMLRVPLTLGEAALLCGMCVGSCAIVGALFGLSLGWVGQVWRTALPKRHAANLTLIAAALGAFMLAPAAEIKAAQGLSQASLVFRAFPIGIAGVIWFNAGYWFRREEIGERRRLGFSLLGPLAGLGLALGATFSLSRPTVASSRALEGDPHVVIITVEGLGTGDVGALASTLGLPTTVPTPTLDGAVVRAASFSDAISPAPSTLLAHVALFTGFHPLRLGVLSEGHRLPYGAVPLAERLRREGYTTGAFVSSLAVSEDSGIDSGFVVFDDDRRSDPPEHWPVGVEKTRLGGIWESRSRASNEARFREDVVTLARAVSWMRTLGEQPAFVWIQLSGPAASDSAEALARLDADLRGVFAQMEAWEKDGRPVMWVLAGTRGRAVAGANNGPLAETQIRVPLLIHAPKARVIRPVVPHSVRLTDLTPTLLERLGLEEVQKAEGADLLDFSEGTKDRGYATLLYSVGEDARPWLGYRAPTSDGTGIAKLVVGPSQSSFTELVRDPGETLDLSAEQGAARAALESTLRGEAREVRSQVPAGNRPAPTRHALGAP
jgi:arylsulfatase A-like enzyme